MDLSSFKKPSLVDSHKTVSVRARCLPETRERLANWADEMGVTKTSLYSMCFNMGYRALVRQLDPSTFELIKALELGVDLSKPLKTE